MSNNAAAREEATESSARVAPPLATDAEIAKLKRFVERRQVSFEELARRYALQFNLGDVRAPIPKEKLKTLKPLKATETKKLSMLLAARTVLRAAEGLSPEAISEMFRRDGLERWVSTGGKPLLDVKTVVHTVVNWVNSRRFASSITRRLAMAYSSDQIDPGPVVDMDEPQVILELDTALKPRWFGQVAAWQSAHDRWSADSTSLFPDSDARLAASTASEDAPPVSNESPIEYAALVVDLRRRNKPTAARLVEFMADKTSASCEDVGREVHDDVDARDQTIRMNARRTSDELTKMSCRVSFRVSGGWVFKDVSPE